MESKISNLAGIATEVSRAIFLCVGSYMLYQVSQYFRDERKYIRDERETRRIREEYLNDCLSKHTSSTQPQNSSTQFPSSETSQVNETPTNEQNHS